MSIALAPISIGLLGPAALRHGGRTGDRERCCRNTGPDIQQYQQQPLVPYAHTDGNSRCYRCRSSGAVDGADRTLARQRSGVGRAYTAGAANLGSNQCPRSGST